jgi:hypothetical protein
MNPTEINQLIEASARSIRASVQDEMAIFADNVRGDICNRIANDVCDQVCRQASERIRGPALFDGPRSWRTWEWGNHFTPLPDEYNITTWVECIPPNLYLCRDFTCTNYGRIIEQRIYPSQKVLQVRPPGMRLTSEVVAYIQCVKNNLDQVKSMLDQYDKKYAFAHHNIHNTKVEAVRAEIKQELSDEFTKLAAANDLLKARQEAFDKEVARRERELSQRELSAARSRISMIEQHLSQEIYNATEQINSHVPYQEQWESLRSKLVDCKKVLTGSTPESD